MSKNKNINVFPHTTEVELVAIKGNQVFKKIMTYKEALDKPRVKGWRYVIYQVGFCSMKESK